jgi:hypothetical protein
MTTSEDVKIAQMETHLESNDRRIDDLEKLVAEINKTVQRGIGGVVVTNVFFAIIISIIVAWKH